MPSDAGSSPTADDVETWTDILARPGLLAVQDGSYDADHARTIPGPTDFRTWCREILRPAAR